MRNHVRVAVKTAVNVVRCVTAVRRIRVGRSCRRRLRVACACACVHREHANRRHTRNQQRCNVNKTRRSNARNAKRTLDESTTAIRLTKDVVEVVFVGCRHFYTTENENKTKYQSEKT